MVRDENGQLTGEFKTGVKKETVEKGIKELQSHQMKFYLGQIMSDTDFMRTLDGLSAVDGKNYDAIKAIYDSKKNEFINKNSGSERVNNLMQSVVGEIKQQEGFSSTAYPDGAGYSVGYGFQTIDGKPVTKGQTITQEQADRELGTQLANHSN